MTALEIGIAGSLKTTMNIGIEANVQYTKVYKNVLVSYPIPWAGIAVADVFDIGLVVNVGGRAIALTPGRRRGHVQVQD